MLCNQKPGLKEKSDREHSHIQRSLSIGRQISSKNSGRRLSLCQEGRGQECLLTRLFEPRVDLIARCSSRSEDYT